MAIKPNQRFGRLTTIEPTGSRNGRIIWKCKCDCGHYHLASSKHLSSGSTKSCGCWRSENSKKLRSDSAIPFEQRLKRVRGCLEWQGSRDRRGYGTLRTGGKDYKAHRMAFERAFGPIPPGMIVCHRCDNPPCCDPAHLFLGTPAVNSADSVIKNRHSFGARNGNALLTDHTVRQIRSLCASGKTQQEVAEIFGIHQTTVSKIMRRQSWAHVK